MFTTSVFHEDLKDISIRDAPDIRPFWLSGIRPDIKFTIWPDINAGYPAFSDNKHCFDKII